MKRFAFIKQVNVNIVDEDGTLVLSDALLHLRDVDAFVEKHGAELVDEPNDLKKPAESDANEKTKK